MGGPVPKQFIRLLGKPVIQWTMELFDSVRSVHEIVVVAPPRHQEEVERLVHRSRLRKVSHVVAGGKERQDSVWNGLHAFDRKPDIVLVHDAVRPVVSTRVIQDVIKKAVIHRAAVVGVRVRDTIKEERHKGVRLHTLARNRLWAVQTPQGFWFDVLLKAHREARHSGYVGTDDASLVERVLVPVWVVEGDYTNLKITTRVDLVLAKLYMKRPKGG
jgi:2-C-methyl-D-erythritol 4-phosphate cytidylyltransferase